MNIPAQTLMVFLVVLSLLVGLFLLLSGAGMIKHNRLKVLRGNKTIVVGAVFVLLAVTLFFANISQAVVAPTPTPIPTPLPDATREIVFSDDFSSIKYKWETGSSATGSVQQSSEFANGKLAFSASYGAGNTTAWLTVPDFSAKDFGLGFNATITEASSDDPFSVAVAGRYQDANNFYLIRFSQQGRFSIQVKKDGNWKTVTAWTPSGAITLRGAKTKRFDVFFQDTFISLFVNGFELIKVQDATLNEPGKVLIGIDSSEANQSVKVDFDNVVIVNK